MAEEDVAKIVTIHLSSSNGLQRNNLRHGIVSVKIMQLSKKQELSLNRKNTEKE